MTKQNIVDYVMTTPHNPNKAVLSSMLDSLSDGEGGDGSSRVLLYENDAVTFGQSGAAPIKFTTVRKGFAPPYWSTDETYTLEIDDQVAASGKFVRDSSGYYWLGLNSPGDSAGLATYSGGVKAGYSSSLTGGIIIGVDGNMLIDSSKFTAGTHSVKIYKEV